MCTDLYRVLPHLIRQSFAPPPPRAPPNPAERRLAPAPRSVLQTKLQFAESQDVTGAMEAKFGAALRAALVGTDVFVTGAQQPVWCDLLHGTGAGDAPPVPCTWVHHHSSAL